MGKIQKALSFFVLGALVVSSSLIASSAMAEVHFKDISFAEAQKLAAKEKKKIMIDYYTDWCRWCKVLDHATYSNRTVGVFADDHFISIKINAEKGEGIELAKKFNVNAYPTIVFYSPDGKEVDRVVGYQDSTTFLRSLKMASEGGMKTLLEKSKSKESNNPSVWLGLGQHYATDGQHDAAIEAFNKVITLDATNQKHYKEEALYEKGFLLTGDEQIKTLDEAFKLAPEHPKAAEAFRVLMLAELHSKTPENALKRMQAWIAKNPEDADAMNAFAWEASQLNLFLPESEDYASGAIHFFTEPAERASAIDTKAEILFREGRPDIALTLDQEAVKMLNADRDKKLIASLQSQINKFQAAVNQGTTGSSK